jgi:hypothetical protein
MILQIARIGLERQNKATLECWIENELNSFSFDRREFTVGKIFIRCPQPAKATLTIDTGAFAGLPPIALPLRCPAHDQMVRRTPGPQTFTSSAGAKT